MPTSSNSINVVLALIVCLLLSMQVHKTQGLLGETRHRKRSAVALAMGLRRDNNGTRTILPSAPSSMDGSDEYSNIDKDSPTFEDMMIENTRRESRDIDNAANDNLSAESPSSSSALSNTVFDSEFRFLQRANRALFGRVAKEAKIHAKTTTGIDEQKTSSESTATVSEKTNPGVKYEGSVMITECCRMCPEVFEGVDIIPSMSFLEIQARAMPPKNTEMSYEEFVESIPCCPVCLDQLRPPVDAEDSAFLEVEEKTSKFPSLFKKLDPTVLSCCTVCPNDDVPAHVYAPSTLELERSAATVRTFLELEETFLGGKKIKQTPMDDRILGNGCCNFCNAEVYEDVEKRHSEVDGGPFGLMPRKLSATSNAIPSMAPPVKAIKGVPTMMNYGKTKSDYQKFSAGLVA